MQLCYIISTVLLGVCSIMTNRVFTSCELEDWCDRIEKEKSQLKAESDDLRAQVEHIGKTKVKPRQLVLTIFLFCTVHSFCSNQVLYKMLLLFYRPV